MPLLHNCGLLVLIHFNRHVASEDPVDQPKILGPQRINEGEAEVSTPTAMNLHPARLPKINWR
jgi:hypothetical protein